MCPRVTRISEERRTASEKSFGDIGESGQKQIAEAVTLKAGAFREAVAEELGEQSLILAEGDDTVADIARRKHVEFLAQAAAGASVVTDRNHGAEIDESRANRAGRRRSPPG